ncbi:MAG: hypothetical protein KGY50_03950, partial [Candidatus Thermoplasmatota archaeon]|nr:hypothetical protein [Candidatus Thermoplasmatota archaeon]
MFIGASVPVSSQDESTEASAEVVAQLDEPSNKVPAIRVTDYTAINISVRDAFGIPWEQLSTNMPILARYIWPIIHPSWKPFLGFSSLAFETEIIQGDGRGWFHKVEPSAIANADQGRNYNLTLYVKTDDISVDYAVVVGIKVIRKDTSGNEMGVSYIYVPVKSSQLNNVKMSITDTSKEAAPKSYINYEATISNLGYYRGMFELKFEHDENLTVSTENKIIVLESGETKNVNIQVLTEEKLFDIGTPYEIKISAVSSGDPNPIHVGTIRVISKGMYISPLILIIAIPIIISLLIVFIVFFLMKEKRDRQIYGKPDKPWNLPAEKKYLQNLKEKDAEEYQKVIEMMKQEYESALLWWKSIHQDENMFNLSNILSQVKKKVKKGKDKKTKSIESKTALKKSKPSEKKEVKKSEDSLDNKPAKPEKTTEKKDAEEQDVQNKDESEESDGKQQNKSEMKQSKVVAKKIVSGLKKWFTVPEDEKQKESSEKVDATKSVEKKPAEKPKNQSKQPSEQKQKESKTDYEQELDRIEKEQKRLRSQKKKQREQSEKQKAIEKIKKDEQKQKR